ncbi:AraC family transcriptional regulator [Blautia schinkii]|nr:AraC family transcriptional regulator [Blautia schinkii]
MKIRVKENQLEAIEGLHTEYPYVLHHVNLKETKVPWHWHEELEFDYVVSGTIKVVTASKTYIFHKNEACFINTNVLCLVGEAHDGEECILDSHLFHPVFLSGHFKSVFETKYLDPVLQNKKIEVMEIRGENKYQTEMLKKLRQVSFLQSKENMEFETRNLFSEIWVLLLKEIENLRYEDTPVKLASQERIQTMMVFIHENYQNKISLRDIAASAMVSERECLRCFQESIHKTPFEYLLDYRIETAERLLRTTNMPVTDIAMETGFSSAAYFGKVFKNISGKTPGAFRKQYELLQRES